MEQQSEENRRQAQELLAESIALTVQAIQLRMVAGIPVGEAKNLRRTITAFAKTLRAMGEPSHHTIEKIRLMTDDAVSEAANRGVRVLPQGERKALVDQLVLWTVDAYVE
jgi:hypothetical protein